VRREAHVFELVQQARQLVDAEAAGLVLGCPVPELRHPLLDLLLPHSHVSTGYYGSPELKPLLEQERVRALIDLAVQSGQVHSSNDCGILISNLEVRSLAVVPVEQPAGLLGLFLIVKSLLGAFSQGEHRLLDEYRQATAPDLERAVRDLYLDLMKTLIPGAGRRASPQIGATYSSLVEVTPHGSFDAVKSEFVSMVSHELRAPLTAIKGYAGLLQAYSVPGSFDMHAETEMTPERQQHYLHVIMEQVDHLEVIIADLLDISRIESGRLALRFSNVNIAQLCRRVTRLTQDRVDQQQPGKYHIRCDLDPGLPFVWADADRVEQVLQNLLDNALKYSPDGGLIEVLACVKQKPQQQQSPFSQEARLQEIIAGEERQEPLMMHITVRDYGIGIPDGQHSQLFKPYNRLMHPATASIPGIGLGLYITSKFVEAMQGEISLMSREAEGTSISFTLPLAGATMLLPQRNGTLTSAGEKSLVTST